MTTTPTGYPYTPTDRVRAYAYAYLTDIAPNPAAIHATQLPDEPLPPDWQEPYRGHPLNPGDRASTAIQAASELLQASILTEQAFALAGFEHPCKAAALNKPPGPAHLLEHLWEFRRFGIHPTEANAWLTYNFTAPEARVYIDARHRPWQAENHIHRLHQLNADIGGTLTRHQKARITLLVLDHPRLPITRAHHYVLAGVSHDEAVTWEQERRQKQQEVDERLTFLVGLGAGK